MRYYEVKLESAMKRIAISKDVQDLKKVEEIIIESINFDLEFKLAKLMTIEEYYQLKYEVYNLLWKKLNYLVEKGRENNV